MPHGAIASGLGGGGAGHAAGLHNSHAIAVRGEGALGASPLQAETRSGWATRKVHTNHGYIG
ncbi:MAG: hypothetical protein JW986_00270 [Methanotrichaceae archaeon]|nr:hypothetical protein [Methanotrichaceae archaeon]